MTSEPLLNTEYLEIIGDAAQLGLLHVVFHRLAARRRVLGLESRKDCLVLIQYGLEIITRICLGRSRMLQISLIYRQSFLYHAVSGAGIDDVMELQVEGEDFLHVILQSVKLHEFAHAWVSDKLGDPTPRRQGRVTINPLAHIDWIGFLTLVIVGFGWGKPVQIDPSYYKNRRRDEFLVAIAGVTMNLILAVILSLPAKAMLKAFSSGTSELVYNIYLIIFYAVTINLVLMIFNLIPCPPLDGWGIITQIFRLDRYSWWYRVYQYGTWILLALILTNVTDHIITPLVTMLINILF